MNFLSGALSAALMALLAGCASSTPAPAPLDPQTANVQESAVSDSTLNQTMDSANEALANDGATPTSGIATRSLPIHSARNLDVIVTIASQVDANGARLFPNLSGVFSVHTDGEVISSTPTGTTVLGTHTVTVNFDQGAVTYTEPTSGLVATISSGTYTYTLDTSYHNISNQNWDLNLDASLAVPAAPAFALSIARSGFPARSVAVSGHRHALTALTRRDDSATINNTLVDRTVTGATTGVNPSNTGEGYADWTFTIDGADTVVWNRYFHANVTWNYAPISRTVNAFDERVFITRDGGTKLGPYTTAGLVSAFQTGMEN